ncbi:type II toxin-antitoxin system VapC family toxin [Candidatus Halobeggiatoa sp. HSG11]|nr:type II toxin-antitoxin system VapC family toxin [Candidatus Halobeggiatoa sp. HSG11]
MIIFFDTSAWVKYFLNEEGTLHVQSFMTEHPFSEDNLFVTSAVTYVEMIATLTRACRGRRINEEELETIITVFQEHWS